MLHRHTKRRGEENGNNDINLPTFPRDSVQVKNMNLIEFISLASCSYCTVVTVTSNTIKEVNKLQVQKGILGHGDNESVKTSPHPVQYLQAYTEPLCGDDTADV